MSGKIFIGVTIICMNVQLIAADSPVKPPTAETVLKTLNKAHPRLILTDKRLAELKALMKRDDLLKKCYKDVLKQADEYCTKPPLKYKKIGPRLLSVSRACVSRIYTLGLAWRLTGKEKYAAKAKENLLAVCAFKDWNPPHFLDTAEMSHAVGVGYDWLFDYLDAESREKIRAGLINNGLKPGLVLYKGGGTWEVKSFYNWNQVCNGGLIIGALAIAETNPEYARRIVPSAVKLLPRALATYAPDGAWPEGPSYWGYATRYTVYCLAALNTALDDDFGLSQIKGLSETGLFPIYTAGPTGLSFNFADARENLRLSSTPCLFWLARRFDKPMFAEVQREMLSKYSARPRDFIWYMPAGKKSPAPTLDKYFRGPVEVAVFRSAWNDPNALFVAVKAGYSKVNHSHLDIGNFEIDALGVRWARDLGMENYNMPGYSNSPIYRIRSISHNVPVLAGKDQRSDGKARITTFKTGHSDGLAVLDLSSAYKDHARNVTRGVATVGGRRAVLVQDEFKIDKPCEVAWGMTTDAKITVEKNVAVLTIGDKKMTARILSPAGAVFTVESAEQKPPQKTNKGVKRLMIRLKDQKGDVRITVFFAPHWPDGKSVKPPAVKPLKQW